MEIALYSFIAVAAFAVWYITKTAFWFIEASYKPKEVLNIQLPVYFSPERREEFRRTWNNEQARALGKDYHVLVTQGQHDNGIKTKILTPSKESKRLLEELDIKFKQIEFRHGNKIIR